MQFAPDPYDVLNFTGQLFDGSSEGVMIVNSKGQIQEFNKAAERMFGVCSLSVSELNTASSTHMQK